MGLLRWLRFGGIHAGVVGKTVAGGVLFGCFALGSLVGLLLGNASLGGNVGAVVGLVAVGLNVVLSLRYVRRRFDPAASRARGEQRARGAGEAGTVVQE